jgi:menaquinone-dependent protoporphyrinogen oxidase
VDQTRRDFLKVSGAVLTCTCTGAVAACAGPELKAGSTHYAGGRAEARKALVLYGTRAGSTAEVADVIGKTLSQSGWRVDVESAEAAGSPGGYQAVVVGSAIRRGSVLPEVQGYVKARRAELTRVPVAYFVVCMTVREDTAERRAKASAFLDPLRAEVEPIEVGLFAGKVDYSKLSGVTKLMAKAHHMPEGDFRDWTAIAAWVQRLTLRLPEPSESRVSHRWTAGGSVHPA